jgi:hypothetical protein
MSGSEQQGWVCLGCGRTNFYRKHSCIHCGNDRHEANATSIEEEEDTFRSLDEYRSPEKGEPGQLQQNKRFIFLALAGAAFFVWFILMWEYRKWNANWGGLNVLIVTAVAAVVMSWWLVSRRWFRECSSPTGWRFMIIPTAGFIICAAGGIFLTEPSIPGSAGSRVSAEATANRNNPGYHYDYSRSRAGEFYLFATILDLGGAAADADVDEECLPVLLVLLVLLLVVASFFIPHFWVLATFLMTLALAIFTFREWRWVEPNLRH